MKNKKITVGLVIPVHKKDEHFLPNVYSQILYFKKHLNVTDVVFVFNGYADATHNKIPNNYKYLIYPDKLIIGRARNIGATKINSDFTIFMDADVAITETAVENLKSAIEIMVEEKYTALVPKLKQFYGNSYWSEIDSREDKRSYETREKKDNLKIVIGPFIVISTNQFKQLGGFEDKNFCAEDRDLACRLIANKNKIFFAKDVEICHQNSPSLKRIFYRKFFHARCNALIYERYPDFYKRDIKDWTKLIVSKYTNKRPFQSLVYMLVMFYYLLVFIFFRLELRLIHPKDILFRKSDLFK